MTRSGNTYQNWRNQSARLLALRDGPEAPPEALLQQIWLHQRLLRGQLRTVDGKPVRVLHPGFWNHEAGPDFRGAVVQIGKAAPVTGDIEIDTKPGDWRGHKHETNPSYAKVVLHVVWKSGGGAGNSGLPCMAIESLLDSMLEQLALDLGGEVPFNASIEGQCSGPLKALAREQLDSVLAQAGQVRLQTKAAWLAAVARSEGWEQALWTALFCSLGYKQNRWPFQCLAEVLPRLRRGLGADKKDGLRLEARLFGIAGLLPAELPKPSAGEAGRVTPLWDYWWRERDEFEEIKLPSATWTLHGIRPANHPHRRIALAARWIQKATFVELLEEWMEGAVPGEKAAAKLIRVLQPASDPYWSTHFTLRSATAAKAQPLLGLQRTTDIAMNAVLPWFWARAYSGKSAAMVEKVERLYFAWPKGEDNSKLRMATQRLFGGVRSRAVQSAAAQQALLQILQDFCNHSNALCEQCRFPDLVRAISV